MTLPAARAAGPAEDEAPALLVTLAPDAGEAPFEALVDAAGYQVAEQLHPLPVYRVVPAPGFSPDAQQAREHLLGSPLVKAVDDDGQQTATILPSDPLYRPFQWNLRRIGAEQAWGIRPSAPEVIVAVLDSGVDFSHPDLRDNLLAGQGYNFVADSDDPQDDRYHGTAVAGIIGAIGNNAEGVSGIAWKIKILPIKTLDEEGRGRDSDLAKGIIYAADKGARIINVSSTAAEYSAALQQAVDYATGKGALVIAAAGNSGDGDNVVTYPAALDRVVAVSAIDLDDKLAPFSQRGDYVALAAPGVDVPTTSWPGAGRELYARFSGTSLAAPHVAGVAALLMALRPDLSAEQVTQVLLKTADDLGPLGKDDQFGAGVLNAARAVAEVRLGMPPRQPEQVAASTAPALSLAPLPAEPRRWYFAEGSTKPPFDTWFSLFNPNSRGTSVRFTFLSPTGAQTSHEVTIGPDSRSSLYVNTLLPNADFATVVEAPIPVFVERSMFFGHDGHSVAGAREPSNSWYLAEGSTVAPFDTWVLLMNPGQQPAVAKLTFMREDGSSTEHSVSIPARGRRTVYVNELFRASGFATRVEADQPIVVERAMYFDDGAGGHDTVAANAPSRTWYFAEGASRRGFDTWLLVQNPGATPATVRASFLTEDGRTVVHAFSLTPRSRSSLLTNLVVPDAVYGMQVEADQPVLAERAVYFDNGRSGFASTAVAKPAKEWYLAEGATTGSFTTQLAILNPGKQAAEVQVELRRQDGMAVPPQRVRVGAASRLTLDINPFAPDANVALRVTSDQEIVVERSLYFARPNGFGATNTAGFTR